MDTDTVPSMKLKDPETPPPRSLSPRRHILFDSPFSDYYTDTSLSPDPSPSPAQKALLTRLAAIGQQILRKDPSAQKFRWINERLDGVEEVFAAPESQTRQPPELEDSGLFMDGDEVENSQLIHGGGGLGLPDDVVEILRRASLSSGERNERVDSVAEGLEQDREHEVSWEEETGLDEIEAGENDQASAIVASYKGENNAISTLLKESGMRPPTTSEDVIIRINAAIMELRLRFEEIKVRYPDPYPLEPIS